MLPKSGICGSMENSQLKIWAVTILGVACMLPSIGINAIYQFAHAGDLAVALAWAATLSVVLAAISPITFMRSVRCVSATGVLISIFLFAVCSIFNVSNAIGIAAGNRAESITGRETARTIVEGLQWQLGTTIQSRDSLAKEAGGKTAVMVRADLASLQQRVEWASSKQCTDATIPISRAFCADYKTKEGLLDAAARVEDLDRLISEISAKLANAHAVIGQSADPQASTINSALAFFGVKVKDGDVGTGLSLWFALAIEAIGSLGLIAFRMLLLETGSSMPKKITRVKEDFGRILSSPRMPVISAVKVTRKSLVPESRQLPAPAPAKKPYKKGPTPEDLSSIQDWLSERITIRRGKEVQAAECYANYRAWCEEREISPATFNRFGRTIRGEMKIDAAMKSGRVHYQGVAFKVTPLRVVANA